MSQKVTRKGGVSDEKEKRTDSPVKDMKKKLAANAEKDKEKTDKNDKRVEKNGTEKEKPSDSKKVTEKQDKTPTQPEKRDRTPTQAEKKDKPSGSAEKEDKAERVQQKVEENGEKSSKSNTQKPKQNGKHNGTDVTNGSAPDTNGTVSLNEDIVIIDSDNERDDELFPELAYDDDEDDAFENGTPDGPSRSFTRRSQVKATRTPETPRPASDKQADNATEDSKESKVLKLKDDAPERKLRSTDPKEKSEKTVETPKKSAENGADSAKDAEKKDNGVKDKLDVEIVVEEAVEVSSEPRKTDTNFSKSRVKVSPYRRSGRLADQTNTSVMANYTGNNTTMEMDITETSSILEDTQQDDSYLHSLRNIKGRRSYKNLGEMPVKKVNRSRLNVSVVSGSEHVIRPTAPVVGRKRKPEPEEQAAASGSVGVSVLAAPPAPARPEPGGKRARLLDTLARTFTRLPRHNEIVGINSDLPMSAPVAATESIQHAATLKQTDKRCVVM